MGDTEKSVSSPGIPGSIAPHSGGFDAGCVPLSYHTARPRVSNLWACLAELSEERFPA